MDECGNFRKSVTEEELIQIWITQKIKMMMKAFCSWTKIDFIIIL